MDIDPHTVNVLRDCVTALRDAKDELRSTRAPSAVQHIMVTNESKSDASKLMHAAVTAAVVSAVLAIVTLLGGGMLYLNMKDHLDAIYMVAPSLQQQLSAKDTPHADH